MLTERLGISTRSLAATFASEVSSLRSDLRQLVLLVGWLLCISPVLASLTKNLSTTRFMCVSCALSKHVTDRVATPRQRMSDVITAEYT